MQPIEPNGMGELVEIAKDQPQYNTLIARVYPEVGAVQTLWTFSDEERKAIAEGSNLNLIIYTFGRSLQPIHMGIDSLEDLDFN